ncbi:hypothetical protein E4U58_001357 [Claviceps cyperi]|nr:hypothetical protein E4U58_001357 [Claviceps cyperi]
MSMSALAAPMVAKLQSLDSASDWTSWKKSIIDILGVAGYGDLLQGESDATWKTPEGVSPRKALSAEKRWKKRQLEAYHLIISCCGSGPRDLIKRVAPKKEVALIIDLLQKSYRPKGTAEATALMDKAMYNITLDSCKTVAEYAEKLRKARDSVTAFDESCHLPDPWLINMFFNGLGPSYKTFLSSFIANHDIIPNKREDDTDAEVATFQTVIAATQREEQQQKKGEIHAFIAPKSQAARSIRFCDFCNTPGHIIKTCWLKHPELKRARSNRTAKRDELKATKQSAATVTSASFHKSRCLILVILTKH